MRKKDVIEFAGNGTLGFVSVNGAVLLRTTLEDGQMTIRPACPRLSVGYGFDNTRCRMGWGSPRQIVGFYLRSTTLLDLPSKLLRAEVGGGWDVFALCVSDDTIFVGVILPEGQEFDERSIEVSREQITAAVISSEAAAA